MSKPQFVSVFHNYHDCELSRGSESCLPGLPTHASSLSKWCRKVRKYTILAEKHRKTRQVFRSYSAIMAERRRHAQAQEAHGFIIHPFSIIALYREHFICILWMISFLLDPYNLGFHPTALLYPISLPIQRVVDFILFVNIILEFFIGYYVPITKEIVLEPKKIRLRYLKTYFAIDLMSCIPYFTICSWTGLVEVHSRFKFIGMIRIIRTIRMSTLNNYMMNLFLELGMDISKITWIRIFMNTIYIIHWWACIFHGFPVMWNNGVDQLPENSWINHAQLYNEEVTIIYRYLVCLLTSTSNFYGATEANQHFEVPNEIIMSALCLISGFAYIIYFTAHFLQIFGSIDIADSKYDELIYQLEEYSRVKKLPPDLCKRLVTYYEYKFQKKFFNQDSILHTLSEHLRYEILLFNCRHIIEKVMALQGLSKSVVGGLIANFKPEVYLQNDVIIKSGDPPMKMYFISHGTVAVYWSDGQEITHHEDGDFFGSLQEPSIVSVVAAEITETFSMDVMDAKYIFKLEKEVAERMHQLQAAKLAEYLNLAETLEEGRQKSVLQELRRGHLLEKRRLR